MSAGSDLARPRGKKSLSSHLQSRAGIKGVKTALLRELAPAADFGSPQCLAGAIKSLPLRLVAPRPLEEAISTAGVGALAWLGGEGALSKRA